MGKVLVWDVGIDSLPINGSSIGWQIFLKAFFSRSVFNVIMPLPHQQFHILLHFLCSPLGEENVFEFCVIN